MTKTNVPRSKNVGPADGMTELFTTINKRKKDMPSGSYTTSLFKAGLDRIALKVAEESMEVIHAATKQTKRRLIEETVDLLYHLVVLLTEKNVSREQVEKEILKRTRR